MSEDTQTHKDMREGFLLKIPDRKISSEEPWADDALDRTRVATALTNLVSNQSEPLTISLHGDWGTGKTFLLQRWQKDLEKNRFKSIYFNAWEDDFCDDPFVAIIGQLSKFLKNEKYNSINNKFKTTVKPIIKKIGLNILSKAISVDLNEILEQFADKTLSEYSLQNANKDKLKKSLQEISDKVHKETKQPLIFIIDELDRCRPTFAIELLERVKHIFDIPGIVFVFGINHDELCSAIESIYGKIDTDVYLRRFFDMQFLLPEANSKMFCKHLINRYDLGNRFFNLSTITRNKLHSTGFGDINVFFPVFIDHCDLSLRDIDSCIRSIAFVGKNISKKHYMHPFIIGVLIVLRLKNRPLYQRFIKGDCPGAEIMNYIYPIMANIEPHSDLNNFLYMMEFDLYKTDTEIVMNIDSLARPKDKNPLEQLRLLVKDQPLTHPEVLSKKIQEDKERATTLFEELSNIPSDEPQYITISYISSLIELATIVKHIKTE